MSKRLFGFRERFGEKNGRNFQMLSSHEKHVTEIYQGRAQNCFYCVSLFLQFFNNFVFNQYEYKRCLIMR